jgi:hypothetical protein
LIVKLGRFIPENEKWLYTDNNISKLDQAIEWTESNPRRENFAEIEDIINDV